MRRRRGHCWARAGQRGGQGLWALAQEPPVSPRPTEPLRMLSSASRGRLSLEGCLCPQVAGPGEGRWLLEERGRVPLRVAWVLQVPRLRGTTAPPCWLLGTAQGSRRPQPGALCVVNGGDCSAAARGCVLGSLPGDLQEAPVGAWRWTLPTHTGDGPASHSAPR